MQNVIAPPLFYHKGRNIIFFLLDYKEEILNIIKGSKVRIKLKFGIFAKLTNLT